MAAIEVRRANRARARHGRCVLGEIDFNSDLQPGDHFRLSSSAHPRRKLSGYGAILAAEFLNDKRKLKAVRFTPERIAGVLRRERPLAEALLLQVALDSNHGSSRFSTSRKHPILGYARAHNGVDYYAPAGAPVGSSLLAS
jgi:murein DD-endopeptidase MepM/ murein hydrolase activator NlpD